MLKLIQCLGKKIHPGYTLVFTVAQLAMASKAYMAIRIHPCLGYPHACHTHKVDIPGPPLQKLLTIFAVGPVYVLLVAWILAIIGHLHMHMHTYLATYGKSSAPKT